LITEKYYDDDADEWKYRRMMFSKISETQFVLDHMPFEHGQMEYEIEVADLAGNIARREFTMTVLPRALLEFSSLSVPALRTAETHELSIFNHDDSLPIRIYVRALNWTVDESYLIANDSIADQARSYYPSVMLSAGGMRDIEQDEWHEVNTNNIALHVLSDYKGRLTGELDFNLQKNYKSLNNRSKFDIRFDEYTLLPSQDLDIGGRLAQCDLSEDKDSYLCYTEFPSTMDIRSVGVIVSQFDIDAVEAGHSAELELKDRRIKNISNVNLSLIGVVCVFCAMLVFIYFRYFSGIRLRL
jgi:hypothetical protein